jgi:hypothetical protein
MDMLVYENKGHEADTPYILHSRLYGLVAVFSIF